MGGEAMQVGYLGLGAMGGALARRLLLSRPLEVFDLNPASVSRLTKLGASAAPTPAELARRCDVVIICVPRSANVRETIFAPGGLGEGLKPGKIVIDQTSGDPNETRAIAAELAKAGVRMLDAPVSGGPKGAEAGTIAIMVGGEGGNLDEVMPILNDISPNVTHCGEIGAGQVLKLINNTISTCNRFAMLEGVAMGIRNGLDLSVMQRVLNAGGARSALTEQYLANLVKGGPKADFTIALMLKDLNLASELAVQSGAPLGFGHMARVALEVAGHMLGKDVSIDEVANAVARLSGIDDLFASDGV
jgi:3-hydroxyisobutyrate dehydrogenase